MTPTNHVTNHPLPTTLATRMIIGGSIALILISFFLFGVQDDADPAWGRFWMVRPLIMVPVAGAIGGACNHYLNVFRKQFQWKAAITIPLGILIYIVGLWMGSVLGLDGTLWS